MKTWFYCACKGEPNYDNDGNVIGLTGTIQDISERKKYESIIINSRQEALKHAQSKVVGANVLFSEMDQVEARLESGIDDNIQKSLDFILSTLSKVVVKVQDKIQELS